MFLSFNQSFTLDKRKVFTRNLHCHTIGYSRTLFSVPQFFILFWYIFEKQRYSTDTSFSNFLLSMLSWNESIPFYVQQELQTNLCRADPKSRREYSKITRKHYLTRWKNPMCSVVITSDVIMRYKPELTDLSFIIWKSLFMKNPWNLHFINTWIAASWKKRIR